MMGFLVRSLISSVSCLALFVTAGFTLPASVTAEGTGRDTVVQSSEMQSGVQGGVSTIGDQATATADSMPDNPSQPLPDNVAKNVPDDSVAVAKDLVQTPNGELKNIETGQTVTDPALVGTPEQQPDPLQKTDGESFIPVAVEKVKDSLVQVGKTDAAEGNADVHAGTGTSAQGAVTSSAYVASSRLPAQILNTSTAQPKVEHAALQNNQYGAYWGSYKGTPAFFERSGNLFAQQAKGVIDVSEHQGEINWNAVKNSGVEGAIIRIGYGWGNGFDERAQRNISECKRLGIPFGIYLYSYSYDNNSATAEGNNVVSLLRQAGVKPSDLSYPVFYDLENWTWRGHTHPTTPGVYNGIVNSWWSRLQAAGYNNLSVYSYTSYLNNELNSNNIRSKTRWVASYGARTGFGYSSNDRGWQYTNEGGVAGISGNVDLNAFGNAQWVDYDPAGVNLNSLGNKVTNLKNGNYYILTAYSSKNKYLVADVTGGSHNNGVQLDTWTYNGQPNQQFALKGLGNGQYSIQAVHSGKVADASGPSLRNGTAIVQFPSNGQSNQKWTIYRNNSGISYIASVYAGNKNRVWDITGANSARGTKLELWAANGQANQQFRLVPVGDYQPGKNGWATVNGVKAWFDNGVRARSKEVYDPSSKSWYWFDANGNFVKGWQTLPDGRRVYYDKSGHMLHGEQRVDGAWRYFGNDGNMAVNKDVHVWSNGGKWVRYDKNGKMVYGEDYRFGGWYYFNKSTGAMSHGWEHLTSNGGKWVYYSTANGKMVTGEQYIDNNWYYFNTYTGATVYGWMKLPSNGGKTVYYDPVMGWMTKGWRKIDGRMRHFNEVTGALMN